MWTLPTLKVGDLVEVRSKEEILATLDADGTLESMPFMPEMLQYCGRQIAVAAVAHKTCDTAHRTGGRKLDRMVHLNGARCDGSAHGGCEADCNLFWREEWLRPVSPEQRRTSAKSGARPARGCTEERLHEATRATLLSAKTPPYRCQATQLFAASSALTWWDLRQYVYDVRTGNHRFGQVVRVLCLAATYQLMRLPLGYRMFRSLYGWLHVRLTGQPPPHVTGIIPQGATTPVESLGLRAGELVRVKPVNQIAATLNVTNKNRGMLFDVEEVPYCGKSFRVRGRVTRIINERSGCMLSMQSPCIILESVVCQGHYSQGRLLCPRAITPYWRENWLERAGPGTGAPD
jgi:hypothetical protein